MEKKVTINETKQPKIQKVRTLVYEVENKPFVRLFGYGIFLEVTPEKANEIINREVEIKYTGLIAPGVFEATIVSVDLVK